MSFKEKLNVVVFGGSGDLANKKIYPAFFDLYSRGLLEENVSFFAFSRSESDDDTFREKIASKLSCRYGNEKTCASRIKNFTGKCHYFRGEYSDAADYRKMFDFIRSARGTENGEYIFYFAVPSDIFLMISSNLKKAGKEILDGGSDFKLVIEKPFGRDRSTSDALIAGLAGDFTEKEIYRIDHYLGKEMVQNLLVLRFANQFLEPLWNKLFIESVNILWTEDIGINGRGRYFDDYGIIRDVVQNHLLQILALIAMEEPAMLTGEDIRNNKVKLLRAVKARVPDGVITGQYTGTKYKGVDVSGYRDDPTVKANSCTETYARLSFNVETWRWNGVPFVISAGKGMKESKTEVRIKFREPKRNLFCGISGCPSANELIIRIQPNEGFNLKISTKKPGGKFDFVSKELDLSYGKAFCDAVMPDAYENLLLDVVNGNHELFIRDDELSASWDILMPVINYIEKDKIMPALYPFGSEEVHSERSDNSCSCAAGNVQHEMETVKF